MGLTIMNRRWFVGDEWRWVTGARWTTVREEVWRGVEVGGGKSRKRGFAGDDGEDLEHSRRCGGGEGLSVTMVWTTVRVLRRPSPLFTGDGVGTGEGFTVAGIYGDGWFTATSGFTGMTVQALDSTAREVGVLEKMSGTRIQVRCRLNAMESPESWATPATWKRRRKGATVKKATMVRRRASPEKGKKEERGRRR